MLESIKFIVNDKNPDRLFRNGSKSLRILVWFVIDGLIFCILLLGIMNYIFLTTGWIISVFYDTKKCDSVIYNSCISKFVGMAYNDCSHCYITGLFTILVIILILMALILFIMGLKRLKKSIKSPNQINQIMIQNDAHNLQETDYLLK